MEVGCLVSSTEFNDLVNATHCVFIKKNKKKNNATEHSQRLSMTLVTFLSFSSRTKRRKAT